MALSTSLSAENLTCDQSSDSSSMCLELALEGERLCKSGDCRAGIAFFQAAISSGTNDLRTLSAIYSQLGNAYFYLNEYNKAMQFHKLDLTLARSMNDRLGEAKSSGNLGNTLKVMGRFEEAIICCERHLTIAMELGDKCSLGRALYNIGNVYHAKGKQLGQKDSSTDYSQEVKEALNKAIEYYQKNLTLMKELGDRGAQGRACGNLGNTYYLLGDFQKAIEYHKERLKIAKEFGDKTAERRANSNLGNSHIFLGEFETAAEHYKKTLSLAIELGEQAVEAQACYSLGNTYTLLREFLLAINYHQRHLSIAQELGDRVGEARACWSLGNAHAAISNNEKALYYAQLHYVLAKEVDDVKGQETARMNITDLRRMLGMTELSDSELLLELSSRTETNDTSNRQLRVRRQSMEQLNLIKLTPDTKHNLKSETNSDANILRTTNNQNENLNDLFDLLSKSQSKRMDDQRCVLNQVKPLIQQNGPNESHVLPTVSKDKKSLETEELIEMVAELQSERIDEQRAILPGLKDPNAILERNKPLDQNNANNNDATHKASEEFFDMLVRCQGTRLEEQRSELPKPNSAFFDTESREQQRIHVQNNQISTIDEDFFALIMKTSARMEDQRAELKLNFPASMPIKKSSDSK